MLLGQQLVLKRRGFRPSVQGQGLKRGGRDGGTFKEMISKCLKKREYSPHCNPAQCALSFQSEVHLLRF